MKNQFKEKYKNIFENRFKNKNFGKNCILKCVTQRVSGHNLEIENSGQYKIPRKDRICKLCHLLDNEDHSFLNCKINKTT